MVKGLLVLENDGEDHHRLGVERLVHHWCKGANTSALFG